MNTQKRFHQLDERDKNTSLCMSQYMHPAFQDVTCLAIPEELHSIGGVIMIRTRLINVHSEFQCGDKKTHTHKNK